MLDLRCECGAVYHASPEHFGKRIRCTACGRVIEITDTQEYANAAVRQQVTATPVTPVTPRAAVRPHPVARKQKARKWSLGWGVWAVVAGIVVVLFAAFLVRRANDMEFSPSNAERAASPSATSIYSDTASNGAAPSTGATPSLPRNSVTWDTAPDANCPDNPHRLANGTRIEPDFGTTGEGALTVENGTQQDATVALVRTGTEETVRDAYVQAHHSLTLNGIEEGTYRLMFAVGANWDSDDFTCSPSYSEFEKVLSYSERDEDGGRIQKTVRVTLHPVPQGNARTRTMSRKEFHRLANPRQG